MPLHYSLIIIFIGGGVGSVLRYLVSGWFQSPSFPWGTLLVNLMGCFCIGFLSEFLAAFKLGPSYRLALIVGLLGGFTTFSAFGFETLNLTEDKKYFLACLNIVLSVGVGLFAVWLGRKLVLAF